MPNATIAVQHVHRARQNEAFAQHFDLDTTPYRDWVVTGYFYAALHWIDAFLCASGKRTDKHSERNTHVNNIPELTPISRQYRMLYSYSRNVRYDLVDFTPERVRKDVQPKLQLIRAHMEALLKQEKIIT